MVKSNETRFTNLFSLESHPFTFPSLSRLLTIIIAVPIFVSTSYILYKRGKYTQTLH